jgi:hypothetical protein
MRARVSTLAVELAFVVAELGLFCALWLALIAG